MTTRSSEPRRHTYEVVAIIDGSEDSWLVSSYNLSLAVADFLDDMHLRDDAILSIKLVRSLDWQDVANHPVGAPYVWRKHHG